jgi:CheY-like chemotaxis protein
MDRTLRVLIVDPYPDTAASTAWLVRWWGHSVHTAGDGPAALEAARFHQPDVVLMELALPVLNGCAVARRLRQLDQAAWPLLVAVTGYGGVDYRRRSWAAGFDYHLLKPVDPARLEGLLARCRLLPRRAAPPEECDESADGPGRRAPPALEARPLNTRPVPADAAAAGSPGRL